MSDPRRATERGPLTAVVVLCFGGLAAALTQTLVIPIQSELPVLLGTSAANAAWVVTITLLAGAVAMPVSGRIADLVGKQRVLVASAGVLVAGSLVCALSDSLAPVLVGRALQGIAMGFIPVGISLMREVTPPHLTGTATAAMSATLGVGGAIGLPSRPGSSRWATGTPSSGSPAASPSWCSSSPGCSCPTCATHRADGSTYPARWASRSASCPSWSASPRRPAGGGATPAPWAPSAQVSSCSWPGAPSSCARTTRWSTCARARACRCS
ncbi:MFS transporter [Nocardioides zeae]